MGLIHCCLKWFAPSVFKNARIPQETRGGRFFLRWMNQHHVPLIRWALERTDWKKAWSILDVGCGGGRAIEEISKRASRAKLYGLDVSPQSVQIAKERLRKLIERDRVELQEGEASSLPYADHSFDIVTAFETIYYWPNLKGALQEIKRVLRPGGKLLICNEDADPVKAAELTKLIEMRIYTAEELCEALNEAGFDRIWIHSHEKQGWVCLIAPVDGDSSSK